MKAIITILVVLLGAIAEAGHDQGGGGGGFCIKSKCVTLAEAGFRLKKPTLREPVLNQEVFEEMYRIIDQLPISKDLKDFFKKASTGERSTYESVDDYSEGNFQTYIDEYIRILKENSNENIPSNKSFKLFAVSENKSKHILKTYILPDFKNLSLRSKALTLIHEGVVRKTGDVEAAIRLDGVILDNINGKINAFDLYQVGLQMGYEHSYYNDNQIKVILKPLGYSFWAYVKEKSLVNNLQAIDFTNLVSEEFDNSTLVPYASVDLLRNNSYTASILFSKDHRLWEIMEITNMNRIAINLVNLKNLEHDLELFNLVKQTCLSSEGEKKVYMIATEGYVEKFDYVPGVLSFICQKGKVIAAGAVDLF